MSGLSGLTHLITLAAGSVWLPRISNSKSSIILFCILGLGTGSTSEGALSLVLLEETKNDSHTTFIACNGSSFSTTALQRTGGQYDHSK